MFYSWVKLKRVPHLIGDVKSDPCRFRPVPALAPMVAEVDRGAWDNGRKYENMKYPSTF